MEQIERRKICMNKNPYEGTLVWIIELDSKNEILVKSRKIPLWIGYAIRNVLQCDEWFDSDTINFNSKTYSIVFNRSHFKAKDRVMIYEVKKGICIDMVSCDQELIDYVKETYLMKYQSVN